MQAEVDYSRRKLQYGLRKPTNPYLITTETTSSCCPGQLRTAQHNIMVHLSLHQYFSYDSLHPSIQDVMFVNTLTEAEALDLADGVLDGKFHGRDIKVKDKV